MTTTPTDLDPMTALLVVDVQKGILRMPPPQLATSLVETTARLADAFHAADLPVVWVHATGLPRGRVANPIPEGDELPADFSELDDRLPAHDGDHHVTKARTWSAFPGTDLADHLRAAGVTQVVICGIATGAGVESTARSAYDEGFHVTVVSDAVLDGDPARHTASLERDLPAIGHVAATDDILTALNAR
ncbi:cysteine hydrolase family protein [Calidifontibacter terrae]